MSDAGEHGDTSPQSTTGASAHDFSAVVTVTGEANLAFVADMPIYDAVGRRGTYTGPVRPAATETSDSNLLLPHTSSGDSTDTHLESPGSSGSQSLGIMIYEERENEQTAESDAKSSSLAYPSEYKGPWRDGLWHGDDGHLVYRNGDTYQGSFHSGHRHGHGTMKWRDSRQQYTGQFHDDLRHGQGSFAWPDGALYQGTFVRNQRSGHGTYHTTTVSYIGEWLDGVYHGQGIYKYQQDGQDYVYNGQFQQGKPHGLGILVGGPTEGTTLHDGEWREGRPINSNARADKPKENDSIVVVQNRDWHDLQTGDLAIYRGLWDDVLQCPVGNGSLDYQQGAMSSYEGCFKAPGHFHGHGRLQWKNGDIYEGEFDLGLRHGEGQYCWSDGRHYQGDFEQNHRHGHGRFMYPNNDFYEGTFENGQRHGHGRFVFADGSVYDGEWKDGQYHGEGTLVQSDGHTYKGHFEAGVAHGQGKEIDSFGSVTYEGEWVRGQRAERTADEQSRVNSEGKGSLDGVSISPDPPIDHEEVAPIQSLTLHQEFVRASSQRLLESSDAAAPADLIREWNPSSACDDVLTDIACEAVVDQNILDSQGDAGRYTGIVTKETRLPHGVGRFVYADGKRIHEGFWVLGQKQGHGRCLFTPQGDFHEGEYHENLRHGPGRYVWKDGRTYVGHYLKDLRHGHGVFVYPSGDRYEGLFAHGVRSGRGRYVFDNGTALYDGEWASGKYHGKGHLLWRSPTGEHFSYDGEFQNGLFHGEGVKKDAAGREIEQGRWESGQCVTTQEARVSQDVRAASSGDILKLTPVLHEPDERVSATQQDGKIDCDSVETIA